MSITQTGSILRFALGALEAANTGTVSSTITVPADAELVVVGWAGYSAIADYFSTGKMMFTKGSVDTDMVSVAGGDASTSFFQGGMFYLALPDTGSNKSLKWDWAGTSSWNTGGGVNDAVCTVTFWKGIDTSSPVRDSDGAQAAGTPYTTPTLTAQTGDLIVAFVSAVTNGTEGSIDSWSNLTLLENIVDNGQTDSAWATGSPSGNTTVAASTDTNLDDGAILAIVLKPATAGTQDLTPSLYSDADAFFTHVVAAGAVDLGASLFSDSDAFFIQTVNAEGGPSSIDIIQSNFIYMDE